MKKRVLSLLLAVLIACILIPTGEAQTGGSTLAEWEYALDEEAGTITLAKYIGDADSVTVPASFDVQGEVYDVVLASGTVFRANTNLKSAAISAGVGFLNHSMRLLFGECSALTSVDLSAVDTSDVVSMSYLFYNCTALKAVDLSALDTRSVTEIRGIFSGCNRLSGLTGYENWNTSSLKNMSFAFNNFVNAVSASVHVTIDLRSWDLSHINNSGWCFQNCRAQQILLPDNLAVMSAGFLNHATRYEGTCFTVPAGVKKIGFAHTLYDFATNDLTEIRVAQGNTDYKAVDGVLYSADGREMLAVPRNKPFENGVFAIPEGVDFLGELSFSRNYNIHTVILPDTYVIEYVPLHDERYIVFEDTGNLNAGTNLSIAIYCYTGVTDYAVKDTNPLYASADGIIYSKDRTHVVAVPARYNKAMQIPEGVTHWDREAMWADGSATVDNLLADCTLVTIPSTMEEIADDQLAMLNRLYSNRKGTSNPFTITVAEGNTEFCLDENGALCRTFTVTFRNDDGTALQSGKVAYGETPVYTGETPTKPADDAHTYTFADWTPAIEAATGDATYTATFTAHDKPQDWQSVTITDRIRINFLLDLDARPGVQSVTIRTVDPELGETGREIACDDLGTLDRVDGKYRCSVVLAPAQIGDTVRVTVRTADGEETFASSVAEYCRCLIGGAFSDDMKALAAAMLEYGQAANDHFAGTGVCPASQIAAITEATKAEHVAQAQALENRLSLPADGKISSVRFMALSRPEYRFYVDPACGLTEADFAALNDRIAVSGGASARFVKTESNADAILLEVTGVAAENMDEVITVTIDGFGTIEFCGNDFARLLAQNESTRTLGTALYLYGDAAGKCFA